MYCRFCGTKLEEDEKFCHECGAPAHKSTNFSYSTFFKVPERPAGISMYNRWLAFVLCLVSGCFGIHRFYVGKIGTGILYLFTGGLFGIGWVVDLIMIAMGSFTDALGNTLVE